MKQTTQLLCCVAVLALPCGTLGAVVSKVDRQSTHTGKIVATDEGTSRGLRGALQASKVPQRLTVANLHIPGLKASSLKKKGGQRAGKHSQSWLQRRFRTKRRSVQRQNQTQKVGLCRGSKLRWWIKIKKKCNKAFGSQSRWDRDKQEGKCGEAWNECNTGFYAVCCTQPLGPKNMDAYCAQQNLTFINASDANANKSQDKACTVTNQMNAVKDAMDSIKSTIGFMDQSGMQKYGFGPGPGPAPMPAPAPAVMQGPPSGLLPAGAPAPSPAFVFGPPLPSPLESRCLLLTELTRQAAERIKAVKLWAETGGFEKKEHHHQKDKAQLKHHQHEEDEESQQEENVESAEAKDPDLFLSVKGVLQIGKKLDHLLKNSKFCSRGPDEDDDDDDDAADLEKDPTEDWDDDDEEDEEESVMKINETSILDLLNWEGDMKNAIRKFEKDVHPHGFKWWRYRYEYTIVESMVLAFSVLVMYLTMWLLSGVSFFDRYKFYKTGITARLDRYAWGYFVFHAAALMIMVTLAYMLYIPWGKLNIFNMFAEAFHDAVDGRFNVPFLGYSWLYMVLDVQFQLFVCYTLYSFFIVMISNNFKKALQDFKALSDEREDLSIDPHNHDLYTNLERIMKKRVETTPEYINTFTSLKLRLKGVQALDKELSGWNDFKIHLYLTDGLGKSVEYLVEVSRTTNIFLASSALVVAVLAHHFQVAFMYFLPGFLVLGVAMFVASYFLSRHFRKLSESDAHNTPLEYLSVRSYCRAIQIMLYCLFFSFSRLLLSNDIFEDYPMVYLSSVVGLAVCLGLLTVFAGRLIKEAGCALIIPPHLEDARFKSYLKQVVFWHTTEQCHECGSQQFAGHASLSRSWAATAQSPSLAHKDPTYAPDSERLSSFR